MKKKGDVSRTTPVPLGTERIPGSFAQDMPPFRRFCCSWGKNSQVKKQLGFTTTGLGIFACANNSNS